MRHVLAHLSTVCFSRSKLSDPKLCKSINCCRDISYQRLLCGIERDNFSNEKFIFQIKRYFLSKISSPQFCGFGNIYFRSSANKFCSCGSPLFYPRVSFSPGVISPLFPALSTLMSICFLGIVSTTKSLDREEQAEYTLEITARNGSRSSKALLVINIDDVNDHSPLFLRNRFQVILKCGIFTAKFVWNHAVL